MSLDCTKVFLTFPPPTPMEVFTRACVRALEMPCVPFLCARFHCSIVFLFSTKLKKCVYQGGAEAEVDLTLTFFALLRPFL